MEDVYNSLEQVIEVISKSDDYVACVKLKEQMRSNEDIVLLIDKIKKIQKKYIRSNYDTEIKRELDSLEEQLMNIPVYYSYANHLAKVNEMIDYVRERLNVYFYKLLNEKNWLNNN